MDLIARVTGQASEHALVLQRSVESIAAPVAAAIELLTACLLNGGRILACGGGVSALDAQQLVAGLVGRFEADRQELAALALGGEGGLQGALAGEFGVAQVLARQVRALAHPGDVLVVFASRGDPLPVLEAILAAQDHDVRVVAVTGEELPPLAELLAQVDCHIAIPSSRPARIREMQTLVTHCLCDGIDALLLGVD